ncbi:MAG: manganese efflux pump [Oscillospiraceae bacterium]|nr:manganese efflux pump [Oscillospiraceae bacterium]
MLYYLEALLLASALSIDALAASFSYGSQKIRIPLPSLVILSLICSAVLGLTMYLGAVAGRLIDGAIAEHVSFGILFGLGLLRVFDSVLKNFIRRRGDLGGQIKFSAFHFKFILQIYLDPEVADRDASRTLSAGEATALALALSLDGVAIGLGAGLVGAVAWIAVLATCLMTVLAVGLGCKLGGRFADRLKRDITWIAGGLLMLLAVLRVWI